LTSSQISPSDRSGALGNGLKQWVSTSPGRRRDSTSLAGGRRMIEMRHDRKAGLLGDLDRHVERCDAVAPLATCRRAPSPDDQSRGR